MAGSGVVPGWHPDPWDSAQLRWWDGQAWTATVHRVPTRAHPAPRLIRTWQDAELVAAEWMSYWGFDNVRGTRAGADGGIDVDSSSAVAQVKAHHKPVGRPVIQALHGVAVSLQKSAICFALESFTPDAIAWADEVGIALFRFDLQGIPTAVNPHAYALARGRVTPAVAPAPVASPAPPPHEADAFVVPHRIDDRRARDLADKVIRRREQVPFRVDGWLTLVRTQLSYSTSGRRGSRSFTTELLHESLSGSGWSPNVTGVVPAQVRVNRPVIPACVSASDIARAGNHHWKQRSTLRQHAAIERHRAQLLQFGVPADATMADFVAAGELLLPVHLCFVRAPDGDHVVVVDCNRAEHSAALSRAATQRGSWIASLLGYR